MSLDAERRAALIAQVREADPRRVREAAIALCVSGDAEALRALVGLLDEEQPGSEPGRGELGRALVQLGAHTESFFLEHLRRSPGSRGGGTAACLLGEIAVLRWRRAPEVDEALVRALTTVWMLGTESAASILMGLEYLSRLGPIPAATPSLRAILGRARREPQCSPSAVQSGVRVLYVNEGEAILPELSCFLAEVAPGHLLRPAVEGLLAARAARVPHYSHDPLSWEDPLPPAETNHAPAD